MLFSMLASFLMARAFHGKVYVFSSVISLLLTTFFSVGVPHYLHIPEREPYEAQNGVWFENPLLFSFPFYASLRTESYGMSHVIQYYQLYFFTFMLHEFWVQDVSAPRLWLNISWLDYFLYFSFFLTLNIVGALIGYWTSKRAYIDVYFQKMKQKFGYSTWIDRTFAPILLALGVFLIFYAYYIRTIDAYTVSMYISYSWMALYVLVGSFSLLFGFIRVANTFKPGTYSLTKAVLSTILVGTLLLISYFAVFDFGIQNLLLDYGEGWLYLNTPVALISSGTALVITYETAKVLSAYSKMNKKAQRIKPWKLGAKAILPTILAICGALLIADVYITRPTLTAPVSYWSYPELSFEVLAGTASLLFGSIITFETLSAHVSKVKGIILSVFVWLLLSTIGSLLLYDTNRIQLFLSDAVGYSVPPFVGIPRVFRWIPLYIVVALASFTCALAIAYKALKPSISEPEDSLTDLTSK